MVSGDWHNNWGVLTQAGMYLSKVKPLLSNLSTKPLTFFSMVSGDWQNNWGVLTKLNRYL